MPDKLAPKYSTYIHKFIIRPIVQQYHVKRSRFNLLNKINKTGMFILILNLASCQNLH